MREERVANAAAVSSGGRGLTGANLWEISTTTVRGLEWPRRDAAEGKMASVTPAPAGSRGMSGDQQPIRGDKQRGEQISQKRREWQEWEVGREGAGQGLERKWHSREGQEQGREARRRHSDGRSGKKMCVVSCVVYRRRKLLDGQRKRLK